MFHVNFSFSASYIAIWILVLFQGLLILALLRQLAELRSLMERGAFRGEDHLPVGSPAPKFAGRDLRTGQQVGSLSLSGSGGIILFVSPKCSVCKGLAYKLRQGVTNHLPPIVVFCNGGEQGCAYFVKRLASEIHLLTEGAEQTAARYHVSGFPTAIVVDGKQKIRGYGHPENLEDLEQLVARNVDAADEAIEPTTNLRVYSSSVAQ